MIAPTMLAVADTLSAVKRYGSDGREAELPQHVQRFAAYERISSTARWSAACSPRSVAIDDREERQVRGDHRNGDPRRHVHSRPSQITTIGAIARIGTVCDATT